jgi:predicted regulator of amino acid metabolism with ACT domain
MAMIAQHVMLKVHVVMILQKVAQMMSLHVTMVLVYQLHGSVTYIGVIALIAKMKMVVRQVQAITAI